MGDMSRAGCAVLVSKSTEKADVVPETVCSIRMKVGERHTEYVGLFEPSRHVTTNSDGWGTFTCRLGSLEVWVPRTQVK